MNRHISKLLLLFIFCLFFSSIHAQNKIDTSAHKLGLCLSGGGAKGLAHIGLLRMLDSLGIIPDYISPFGINGFEEGVVYTVEKSHLPFTWTTHIIKDKDFAFKNFDDAFYVFQNQFSKYDFKDIEWFYAREQKGDLIKYEVAKFTAVENDGKSYKMRMSLYMEAVKGGYKINLQYDEEK